MSELDAPGRTGCQTKRDEWGSAIYGRFGQWEGEMAQGQSYRTQLTQSRSRTCLALSPFLWILIQNCKPRHWDFPSTNRLSHPSDQASHTFGTTFAVHCEPAPECVRHSDPLGVLPLVFRMLRKTNASWWASVFPHYLRVGFTAHSFGLVRRDRRYADCQHQVV